MSRDTAEWPGIENDHTYLFVFNRWFARGEGDGQIVRELVPTDTSGNQLKRNSLHGMTKSCYSRKKCHCTIF